MDKICSIYDCTGCRVCEQICPASAIQMEEDEKGHIYPVINQSLCVDCEKCVKHCPSVHPLKMNLSKRVIAGWINETKARKASTSGGISYALSKMIVSQGGWFCGVKWDMTQNGAKHELTNDINRLTEFQGSKYSHSDTSNIFKIIKSLLQNGEIVLFSGTPCQVAGLKSFLTKDYDNLYTIDLICHGVPSRKILRDRIKTIEQNSGEKVINLKSREKTPNQYFTSVKYFHQGEKATQVSIFQDFFYRGFVENYYLRPNCYACKYAIKTRVSDLTIGDFWGFEPHTLKFRSFRRGTSVILINTYKGNNLFEAVKKNLIWEERNFLEVATCNRNLTQPQTKPEKYNEFWKRYLSGEKLAILSSAFFPTIVYKIPISTQIKTLLKIVLPNSIVERLKR